MRFSAEQYNAFLDMLIKITLLIYGVIFFVKSPALIELYHLNQQLNFSSGIPFFTIHGNISDTMYDLKCKNNNKEEIHYIKDIRLFFKGAQGAHELGVDDQHKCISKIRLINILNEIVPYQVGESDTYFVEVSIEFKCSLGLIQREYNNYILEFSKKEGGYKNAFLYRSLSRFF